MGGNASRRKGSAGESEARQLLAERGYEIIETARGRAIEDIVAYKGGKLLSVEVKNCAEWHLRQWRAQAKAQAAKRKASWLLMVRIDAWPHTFYVEGAGREPCVWRGNGAKRCG